MKYKSGLDDIDAPKEAKKLKPWQINIIVFGIIAIVLNLLAVIYISQSHDIYYWSNADYWSMARNIASGGLGDGLWRTIYNSVVNNEFNYIPALPSALFARLFGQSRMVFILSLVNYYLLPANIIIYLLAKKLGKAPLISTLIVIFTMPITVYLTLNGFTEMGGLVISLLCFYLYFNNNKKLWRYILIGVLLAALMIWNNWFIFFGVSFITAMIADAIIFRKQRWQMSLVTLLSMVVVVALFFQGFLFKRLISTYGNGAFDFQPMTNLKLITRYFGLIALVLLAINSIIIAIRHKEKRTFFVWMQILVCYITFTATQTHGQGHLLMYVPGLAVLAILSVKYIRKEQVLLGIIALALVHTVNIFIPRAQPQSIAEIKRLALVPDFSMRPHTRDSAYDILTLKTTLDNIIPEGEYLGVLSYSDILNSEMLKNAEPSLNIKQYRVNYIANTIPYFDVPDVDISPLCNANYMLVVFPAQTVRADQRILETAVDSFASWSDIACAYEEMYEYETVIDGASVKLFHRIREVTDFEEAQFRHKLKLRMNN